MGTLIKHGITGDSYVAILSNTGTYGKTKYTCAMMPLSPLIPITKVWSIHMDGALLVNLKQPHLFNSQFNKAMDNIRAFELKQMSYSFTACTICHERRLEMKMSNSTICKRCQSDKSPLKLYSSQNNMNPGTTQGAHRPYSY